MFFLKLKGFRVLTRPSFFSAFGAILHLFPSFLAISDLKTADLTGFKPKQRQKMKVRP